ncbi:MAG TPA: D-alanyl-D-alanine carboxypeptidase/D-alanyl-D-alanine-endopeptidase [Terracidiphilus sp.]|jgi:serine-type D-Ala-D-Ala carboxypeptidase/endopeptidase (penicillin-binding protein 4)|nr:D-alanyl-D-alanine carboxypeptidase/D-alanyl-D-alanine-endopeptidase [Terracidiphilus sp.]
MEKSQRVLLVLVLGFLSSAGLQAQVRRAPTAKRPETKAVLRDAPSKGVPSAGALGQRIDAILADPALSSSQVGVSVTTIEGKPLYEHNDGRLFVPASNVKLITTAAAYGLLPVETLSWTTSVAAAGEIDSAGVLHGNLVLLGVGDPTLSIRPYPYKPPPPPGSAPAPAPATNAAENGVPAVPKPVDPMLPLDLLAQQVQQDGVRSVEGDIIGDDSFFLDQSYGQNWSWGDLQWDYGAPVSALTFNDNAARLDIHADPSAPGTTVAEWTPAIDYYTVDNNMTPAGPGEVFHPGIERLPGAFMVRTWGTIPPDGLRVNMAIEDPAIYCATVFKESLRKRGILVSGSAVARHKFAIGTGDFAAERAQPLELKRLEIARIAAPAGDQKVLGMRFSPPVGQDIAVTNKISQNLHAELLLRLLGKIFGADGSFEQGSRVVRQFMVNAGVNDKDFFLYDGSGLSPDDRVAPRAFTRLLTYAAAQPWGTDWRSSLPIAGVDGTLQNRFKNTPLQGKMWAKTGTFNEVNALTGYLMASSGRTVAFSIIVNGRRPGSDAESRAVDRIVEAIAAAD